MLQHKIPHRTGAPVRNLIRLLCHKNTITDRLLFRAHIQEYHKYTFKCSIKECAFSRHGFKGMFYREVHMTAKGDVRHGLSKTYFCRDPNCPATRRAVMEGEGLLAKHRDKYHAGADYNPQDHLYTDQRKWYENGVEIVRYDER